LTETAKKIRETDEKIIEIAFEYGYDSPDFNLCRLEISI